MTVESWVYFIAAKSVAMIKIGVTTDVRSRLCGLRNASPVPLEIAAVIPGDIAIERQMHSRFASSRHHGEWFEASPEILEFIAGSSNKIPKKYAAPEDEYLEAIRRGKSNAVFFAEEFLKTLKLILAHEFHSPRALAYKIDANERTVAQWLRGEGTVSSAFLIRLIKHSDIVYAWVLRMRWLARLADERSYDWRTASADAPVPTAEQLLDIAA